MALLDPTSLAATLDVLNDAFLAETAIPRAERAAIAAWIASRQGLRGSYSRMPAPTADDFACKPHLFTGERLTSRASTSHILGQEACRALVLLGVRTRAIDDALAASQAWLRVPLDRRNPYYGFYCCGRCSVALWRHLAVSDIPDAANRIAAGLALLKQRRDGASRWKAFPYYYTLMALTELDTRAAREELRHAAPPCERLLRREPADDPHAQRRHALAKRVLERC